MVCVIILRYVVLYNADVLCYNVIKYCVVSQCSFEL